MILTEEQREAIRAVSDLPRAIGCTRCHNYIQKNYSNQFAVLRSMIDNKDYVPNAAKLIELLAAGEHDQWADWAQSILDSEPGLSDGRKAAWPGMIATPYENLSEELKDKDRREVHLRSQAALDYIQQQSAEIERLKASLIDLHAEYINTLEKNPECSAWDLDEQSDADQRRLRRNAAHAISIVEPPIYLQAEQLAARIKELEDAHKRSGAKYAKIINELRSSVYANIPGLKKQWDEILNAPANGKIGPDARPKCDHAWQAAIEERGYQTCLKCGECRNIEDIPRTAPAWQITDERVEALWHAIKVLKENDIMEEPEEHLWDEEVTVLQAMLTEADHDKP